MLNLEWFRTFKAIYETGNLTAAAQEIFISQPGASLHLSSLETYTGYRLFKRETRKMVPTERGVMLYNSIIESVNTLVQAERVIYRNCKAGKPTIGAGMGFETFSHTLEQHIAKLPFNLLLKFGEPDQLLHDLHNGTLDLIITDHISRLPNLEYSAFTKERVVLICGSHTDTAVLNALVREGKKAYISKWLKEQTWFASVGDIAKINHFWLANFDCQPDFKPNFVVPNSESILRCLRGSNGFAVMPDLLCKKELASQTVRLAWQESASMENTFNFVKRKRTMHAREICQLEQILLENWVF
ncbi:MAG: LysR family transcriptional regulator [Chitinophagaceae bacterium]